MKIHNIEQRSEEWFEIRKKKMTASHAQAIAANGKGLKTYILELMSSFYSSGEDERYINKFMEHGIEQEPVARTIYEFESGNIVKEVGFVELDEHVGCSPDGLVDDDGMIEIKCLSDKIYFQLLLDNKIDTKYFWQMQMQMYICDRKWCDYVVYNPNFQKSMVIIRVEFDVTKAAKIKEGLNAGRKMIEEIEEKIGGLK